MQKTIKNPEIPEIPEISKKPLATSSREQGSLEISGISGISGFLKVFAKKLIIYGIFKVFGKETVENLENLWIFNGFWGEQLGKP